MCTGYGWPRGGWRGRISRRKGGDEEEKRKEWQRRRRRTAHAHATCPPLYECTPQTCASPRRRTYARRTYIHTDRERSRSRVVRSKHSPHHTRGQCLRAGCVRSLSLSFSLDLSLSLSSAPRDLLRASLCRANR